MRGLYLKSFVIALPLLHDHDSSSWALGRQNWIDRSRCLNYDHLRNVHTVPVVAAALTDPVENVRGSLYSVLMGKYEAEVLDRAC